MKKIYQRPQMEVINIEYMNLMVQSFGDPAEEPAHSREFDLFDFNFDL